MTRPGARDWLVTRAPDLGRSLLALATSVVPFLGLWALMYLSLQVSYLLVLVLAIPAAGFLVRTYILFHDCVHGSLLPRTAGQRLARFGARADRVHAVRSLASTNTSCITQPPATSIVVSSGTSRLHGRRVPGVVMAGAPRVPAVPQPSGDVRPRPDLRDAARAAMGVPVGPAPRIKRSVWATNLALVLVVGGLCWLIGWQFVLVEAPFVFLAGGAGIWLFYVQHQFDHTYWERPPEWSYEDAALRGSSYLRLPKVLQFFSGNIGLHHVHHLNAKIPNYNLQRAHDGESIFHRVRASRSGTGCERARLKLWDEDAARLVTWRDVRRGRKPSERQSP